MTDPRAGEHPLVSLGFEKHVEGIYLAVVLVSGISSKEKIGISPGF